MFHVKHLYIDAKIPSYTTPRLRHMWTWNSLSSPIFIRRGRQWRGRGQSKCYLRRYRSWTRRCIAPHL